MICGEVVLVGVRALDIRDVARVQPGSRPALDIENGVADEQGLLRPAAQQLERLQRGLYAGEGRGKHKKRSCTQFTLQPPGQLVVNAGALFHHDENGDQKKTTRKRDEKQSGNW